MFYVCLIIRNYCLIFAVEMKSLSFDHVVISPNDQIGLHKQSSWELSYIIRGEGLRTIGDRTERFRQGEIVIVVP